MANTKGYKLFKISLTTTIIISFIIALFWGVIQKPKLEQYKVFKIYTKEDKNVISNSVDRSTLKQFNSANSEFQDKYKGDIKLNITPQEGVSAYYRIKVVSNKNISSTELDNIFNSYVDFIKGKDINNIVHISPVKYDNITYTNIKVKNVLISLIQALIFSLALFILFNNLKSSLSKDRLDGFMTVSLIAFALSLAASCFVILVSTYLCIAVILKVIDKYKTNKKQLISIALAALIMRFAVAIIMLVYNYLKYRSLYSYSQTDEIFYYSTGDYIQQSLINFKFPNLKAVTGIDQYGYNFFVGFTKFINNGDVFFTIKIINILISVVFVILFFDFVVKITKNKNIAFISAIFMAIMPTFAVFSSFALRDIIISVSIFGILSEAINLDSSNKKLNSIIKIVAYSVVLWYLRKYALLLILAFSMLYLIVKFLTDRKINILIVVGVLALGLSGLIFVASKMYNFNIFNSIMNYVLKIGILKFLSGIILSLVNLDFIINSSATLYTSTKAIILRSLYPETLFLVLTFPIMCVGFFKAKSKNISLVVTIILMFTGFISIYKIQYGGWFLRTQLQIFPYQYMFIAWGISELLDNSKFKFLKVTF